MKREGTENWLAESKKENIQLFAEIDILLRALDRFFTLENHTYALDSVTARNFQNELVAVRDTITRLLKVLEEVQPDSRKNLYWFQKFTESKFYSDKRRDTAREELFRQDTPEKGFYMLYDSFINLKGITNDLIRTGSISYQGFKNVGYLITKEVRENGYFNPFRKKMNPDFDTISNTEISTIVKSIEDKKTRKQISIIYLYLFRFLRYLSAMDISTQRSSALNSSLVILILLRSEIKNFRKHIEEAFKNIEEKPLSALLHSIAYMFSMETKRVYLQELKDIHRKKVSSHFRGRIENSHGILKNLTEQSVVQLSQHFKAELVGDQIFESFVTKLEQSLRLREDMYVLHTFISMLEDRSGNPTERLRIFTTLRNYMLYFESFTFRLLRFDDYENFVLFANDLKAIKEDTVREPRFHTILESIVQFKIYLETTMRHLSNRAELSGRAIDMDRVEVLISQYV